MKLNQTAAVLLTALVVGSAMLALPAAGSLATPGNPPQPDTENRPPSDGANFTVTPDDHSPGVSTAYTMLSRGVGPWEGSDGLRRIDYYKITTQATRFQDCTPSDARAFGIDRDNDAPGTKTDVGLLRHMEQYSVNGRIISVDIYDEGDLGGSPTYLNDTDETVAQLANCVVTPEEPGWYQFKGYVNGTNYQGNFQEVLLYSEYFYVCDCASEQEAEQKLGPKPYSDSSGGDSDGSSSDGSGGSEPTATRTVTSTATATPERGSGGSGASEPTATRTATPTSTVTPTSAGSDDPSGGADSTPTGTAAGSGGDGGGDAASPTSTAASSGDGGSGGQDGDGGQQGSSDRTTPTAGSGPGFGVLAALGGLLAVGLLSRRRD